MPSVPSRKNNVIDLTLSLQNEAKMRLPAYVSSRRRRRRRLTPLVRTSAPILFYKPVASLIGPLSDIAIPKAAQPVEDHLPDYEVEFVVVIGKPAKDVSEADALDYVLGYTATNDVRRTHPTRTLPHAFIPPPP